MNKIYYKDLFGLTDKLYSKSKEYDVKLNKYYIRYISDETKYLNICDNYYQIYYIKDEALEPLINLRNNDMFSFVDEKDVLFPLILEFSIELKSYERKTKIAKLCGKK